MKLNGYCAHTPKEDVWCPSSELSVVILWDRLSPWTSGLHCSTRMTTSQTVLSLLPNDGAVSTLRTTLSLWFRSWDLSSGFHPCTEGFPVEYSLHFLLQPFNSLLFTFRDYSIQWAFQVKCLLLFCFLKTIIHKYLEHTFSISGFLCYFFSTRIN